MRSDSDLYTFGYRFKPWVGASVASAGEILKYIGWGAECVEVALRDEDRDVAILPWIESDNFNPGYLMRGLDRLPQRGAKPEWRHNQDYWSERQEVPAIDLNGEEFVYDGVHRSASRAQKETRTA